MRSVVIELNIEQQLSQQQPRGPLLRDQARVLADPADSRALRQCSFEEWPRVNDSSAMTDDERLDVLQEQLQSLCHDTMIVLSERIARDATLSQTGPCPVSMAWQRHDNDRTRAAQQSARILAQSGIVHPLHFRLEPSGEPAPERRSFLDYGRRGDSDRHEAARTRGCLDTARKFRGVQKLKRSENQ
jgi:hypothetical protein